MAARVKVEGRDEVARLAASFNRAAGRIEELVAAQIARRHGGEARCEGSCFYVTLPGSEASMRA